MGLPVLHELPTSISELSHLQELSIIGVQIFSMFPEQLLHLQDLRVLHLEGPFSYGGSLPLDWSGVPRLRKLRLLDMSNLFGAFVSRVGTHLSVFVLHTSDAAHSGRAPRGLSQHRQFKKHMFP